MMCDCGMYQRYLYIYNIFEQSCVEELCAQSLSVPSYTVGDSYQTLCQFCRYCCLYLQLFHWSVLRQKSLSLQLVIRFTVWYRVVRDSSLWQTLMDVRWPVIVVGYNHRHVYDHRLCSSMLMLTKWNKYVILSFHLYGDEN